MQDTDLVTGIDIDTELHMEEEEVYTMAADVEATLHRLKEH